MKFHRTPVAAALSTALSAGLLGAALNARAADEPTAPPKAEEKAKLEQVVVTGIRASIAKSLDTKRNADTNVEVVSAEDVGKLPDKNIADALSRLPGVNVQFGGALAMDEAERVSIRGTSPNLNLVTVNSHSLSSGDWHVGDQQSSVRSVGFGMMPSQLIGQSIVYKTQRADLTEGGISGSIDIITRRPLDFQKSLSGEIAVGAVYADLPDKIDPQLSGLIAWKSADNTFGVLLQAFKEDRSLRRDGEETFSYGVISAAQAAASGNPELAGKRMPGSLNLAMFEGKRERAGGFGAVQFKPNRVVELNASAFKAELQADNYNSSAYAVPTNLVANGWLIRNPVIDGNTIVKADLVRPANSTASVGGMQFDHNLRQGAKSETSFYDLDLKVNANDELSLRARYGYTAGRGATNSQPSLTFGLVNPNLSYKINQSNPTDFALTNSATGQAIDLSQVSSFVQLIPSGARADSRDSENYLHLDAEYQVRNSWLSAVKWGVRGSKHTRLYEVTAPRWKAQDEPGFAGFGPTIIGLAQTPGAIVTPGDVPVPATLYPSDWASGLDGNFPRNPFRFDPAQIQGFVDKYYYLDPVQGRNWAGGYRVDESNQAIYLMGDFELSDKVSGNAGLRMVKTTVDSLSYQALTSGTGPGQCVPLQPCNVPGAIVGSRFATYIPQQVSTSHTAALPSLNMAWQLRSDLLARGSLSRSMGRPNYNELAGAVSLNNALLTGTSGNPRLKPVTSNNVDATLQWYFAPRALASVGVFAQHLHDYVKAGTSVVEYFNTSTNAMSPYVVSSRRGVKAQLKGAEGALELPIGGGFGVNVNGTYVDSKDADGVEMLGTSKWTYNLRGYYEDDRFSASLAWNYRSDYSTGFVGNGTNVPLMTNGVITQYNGLRYYDGYGSLALSLGFKITKDISVTFDGNNLLNPLRHTYDLSENAPGYWHESGRQYYLNLHMKF
ncbi:TonB-dependent receptor [Roseateles violae]|uniref:TonB-dependent receptor n=1 Tax=Roseateles violae TaxID=3058042 RepID=A0ABT8DZY8_9BURK|nr:TonB-dependent receptor [Pelomonas sp. PFR6]MDN3923110.1 TonB-dependent receptor [Pelomonas sp. PFR6]